MILGMTLKPGERYTRKMQGQEHLVIAALDCRPGKNGGVSNPSSCLFIKHGIYEQVLCTLEKGIVHQQKLDLVLVKDEVVTFIVEGTGTVHITGHTTSDTNGDNHTDTNGDTHTDTNSNYHFAADVKTEDPTREGIVDDETTSRPSEDAPGPSETAEPGDEALIPRGHEGMNYPGRDDSHETSSRPSGLTTGPSEAAQPEDAALIQRQLDGMDSTSSGTVGLTTDPPDATQLGDGGCVGVQSTLEERNGVATSTRPVGLTAGPSDITESGAGGWIQRVLGRCIDSAETVHDSQAPLVKVEHITSESYIPTTPPQAAIEETNQGQKRKQTSQSVMRPTDQASSSQEPYHIQKKTRRPKSQGVLHQHLLAMPQSPDASHGSDADRADPQNQHPLTSSELNSTPASGEDDQAVYDNNPRSPEVSKSSDQETRGASETPESDADPTTEMTLQDSDGESTAETDQSGPDYVPQPLKPGDKDIPISSTTGADGEKTGDDPVKKGNPVVNRTRLRGISCDEEKMSLRTLERKKSRLGNSQTGTCCRYCWRNFTNHHSLRRHEQRHEDNEPRQLGEEVDKHQHEIAPSGDGSSENTVRHTQDGEVQSCNRTFTESGDLGGHERLNTEPTGMKPHQCGVCGKSFRRQDHLSAHRRIHTGDRPYACSFCDKAFKQRYNLIKHERCHTGQKPYQCSFCNKAFNTSFEKRVHERRHTGETPYQCSFCDKAFKTSSEKTVHERSHTGERPYQCSLCDKAFKTSHHLKSHETSHSSEKPHHCSFCDKAFKTSCEWRRHERIHTREKPSHCSVCVRAIPQ